MRNVRQEFEERLVKDREMFDREFERMSRLNLIIVYGVMVFYIALVIGALIGCYFLISGIA